MRQVLVFVVSACMAIGVVLVIVRQRAGAGTDRATSGELVRCQVSSRSLTILTEDGEASFVVADDAIIHEGTKTASLADICEAIGLRVKVRYPGVGEGANGPRHPDVVARDGVAWCPGGVMTSPHSPSTKARTMFDVALLTWLVNQGHRPNLLITSATVSVRDVLRELGPWCAQPLQIVPASNGLRLPASGAGLLVFTDVSAFTPLQQSTLNDWISAGYGQWQIVSIAITPLESLVAAGRFKEDLFYRLNTVRFDG